jgi:hypothetical protein
VAAPCAPWHCVRGPVRSASGGRPFNTIVRKHMQYLDSVRVRVVLGVLIGLPGMWLGGLALFQAAIALFRIPLLVIDAARGYLRSDYVVAQIGWSMLLAVWGLAGVAGMIGFWLWTFSRRPVTPRRRRWLIGLLSVGIASAAAAAWIWPGIVAWFAFAGCVGGILLIANMCFLTSRWNGP